MKQNQRPGKGTQPSSAPVLMRQLQGRSFGDRTSNTTQKPSQGTGFEFGNVPILPTHNSSGLRVQAKSTAKTEHTAPMQRRPSTKAAENNTGMPDQLKSGMEQLSGFDMSDVRVHRNSKRPAQVNALAYAQGPDIHLGPGQEQHLPHEAWHVVQQKQGRVKPTIQTKGVSISNDPTLEREADLMGETALTHKSLGKPTLRRKSVVSKEGLESQASVDESVISEIVSRQTPSLVAGAGVESQSFQEPIVQRRLRYGRPYRFIGPNDALPMEMTDRGLSIENLSFFINAPFVIGFEDIAAVEAAAAILSEYPQMLDRAIHARNFPKIAAKGVELQFAVSDWVISELRELMATLGGAEQDEAHAHAHRLASLANTDSLLEASKAALGFIDRMHLNMFRLNASRQVQVEDGRGDIDTRQYGYHLTKLHNIPGIRALGLDPQMGASDRGSLAMSTADQQVGSKKTSENVVAFGLHPGIFRPYINQFSDRRQMIEGTPDLLRPAMLRFFIRENVRKSALNLRRKGIVDYMDRAAINTAVAIQPSDIDILTPDGWMQLEDYSLEHSPAPLRADEENERTNVKWKGTSAIFTYDELARTELDPYTVAINHFGGNNDDDDVTLLGRLVDQNVGTVQGISFVFRGATMQTSGHRKSWDYAFSVNTNNKEGMPKWIQKNIVRYQKEFHQLALGQIARVNEDYSGKSRKKQNSVTKAKLLKHFKIGDANGDELNCLLESIDQLRRNKEGSNPESAAQMREVLAAFNLAPEAGMIDIYGGAGMQLANDLGLRIQVIQQSGAQYLVHPIIGIEGRRVCILHTPGHFQPLWHNKAQPTSRT